MLRCIVAACFAAGLWVVGGQQKYPVAIYPAAWDEMLSLGYVGTWARCMYGYAAGDTIVVRLLRPEGDAGCATAPDSTFVLGFLRPMAGRTDACGFSPAEQRAFAVVGHRFQIRWCGLRGMHVWERDEPAPSRIGT